MNSQSSNRKKAIDLVDVGDFVNRLTSRKFALTIIICAYFMWRGIVGPPAAAFGSLTQVVIAFLAIQGGTDALVRFAEFRSTGQPSKQEPNPLQGELDGAVIDAAQNSVNVLTTPEETGPLGD